MKLKQIFQKKGNILVKKYIQMRYLWCFVFLAFLNVPMQGKSVSIKAGVVLYPAPAGIDSSPDYSISVNGQHAFVYNPKVKTGRDHPQRNMGMCYFDCTGSTTITVHANVPMANVVIRPLSYGIKPVINGQDITFTIHKSQKVTIEPNGTAYNPLVIFANAMNANTPKQSDPNVIYFGPGIHTPGLIELKNNQTIYLAGGAVVRGHIHANGASNIKIIGHGIIDESLEKSNTGFIYLQNCSNVTIDGPIMLDCYGWCNHLANCKNVTVSNMKEICWRSNSDGIDVDGCSDCVIDNCYIRNWDDGIAIKSLCFRGKAPMSPRVHDITVQNCIFWTDMADALEIGYELETDLIDSVTFKNIDIIHCYGNNAISIHNSAQAEVRVIRYEDIRIEDMDPLYSNTDAWPNDGQTPGTHVIAFWIGKSSWTNTGGQGTIRNIYFKNISVMVKSHAQFPFSDMRGFDENHTIEGVTFDNFTVDGVRMMNASDAHLNVGPYVKNETFQ